MFLFEQIDAARKFGAYKEVPKYISNNLTKNFELRPYQKMAFQNFITYFENDDIKINPTQVLFHMATGSGKTVIMAGLILYLYKQGYRNFLFFVNSDNIVQKTKDNFLNQNSIKYLFNAEINIDGEYIKINEVDNFQNASQKDINIRFTTIQGLHMDMTSAKENAITFDDFAEQKIALIADEAHHLNVQTKKGKTQSEKDEEQNWEYTVNRIFNSNNKNVLLEFTATCDLKNPYILSEYTNKIIVDYPLSRFREDKFSKEVKTLASHIPLMDRVLQSVLLSQYRLKLFQDNKKNIKPVLLLKHKTITESEAFFEEFQKVILNLSIADIERLLTQAQAPILKKMFEYYNNNISVNDLIQEIKDDFSEEKCISVNSKEDKGKYQILINTLESRNNLIRCIFAVDQLNEGWDVLNLFDIVRLYETRSAQRHGGPGKQTIQEAQLIGRGARYCPFEIAEDHEKYLRKFDEDLDNELRVCETLYYHCQYDSLYISELTTAMKETGIMPDDSIECSYILKDDFKKDLFYHNGLVFSNDRVVKSRKTITELLPSVKSKTYEINLSTGSSSESSLFGAEFSDRKGVAIAQRFTFNDISNINYSIVHKALRQYPIYKFNILQKYYPNLNSTKQFITDNNYLGNIVMEIKTNSRDILPIQFYMACKQTLEKISNSISDIEETYEGTKEFNSKKFCEVFRDKKVSYSNPKGNEAGIAQSDRRVSEDLRLDLAQEEWFVFNDNFGTSEEKAFVAYFKNHVDDLKKKYNKVYLVRNERQLKLFSFNGGERFEPDYLLFLHKEKEKGHEQYQIFIEPKGSHLIKNDIWKEEFLLQIKDEGIPIKTFIDDNNYHIWGFPFFNKSERTTQFKESMATL